MPAELAGEGELLLHVRLTRSSDGGVVGSVSHPGGPEQDFNGWLGLLALLERATQRGNSAAADG